MAEGSTLDVSLHLDSIDHLFVAPDTSPLSANWIDRAGLDVVYQEWLKAAGRKALLDPRITLYLPADQATPKVQAQATAALQRYCAAETDEEESAIQIIRRVRGPAWIVGSIVLGACLAASALIGTLTFLPEWLLSLLSESLIVAGWVALWRPAELLLYDWRPHRMRVRFLDDLSRARLQVQAEAARAD